MALTETNRKPDGCPKEGACYCYSEKEIFTLSQKITECQKTKFENEERIKWVDNHMKTHPAGIEWWQEPTAIISGTVFSLSLGTLIGIYLVK